MYGDTYRDIKMKRYNRTVRPFLSACRLITTETESERMSERGVLFQLR